MPARSSPTTSARRLVERFAAHLAYLLNNDGSVVEIRPFALYQRLLRTLGNEAYRPLIGAHLAGGNRSTEEMVQKYFDAVLHRPLQLARANATHKGHDLLLALCRRGVDPLWISAALQRVNDPRGTANETGRPHDFDDVASRLARIDKSIGPGNPATGTREHRGPLRLHAGDGSAEVAEELPLWGAITCAPARLRKLEPGLEFNAFCSLVIKAVEAANAPYGALIGLRLSPFDWQGELSTNTLKKLSAFLSEVRKNAGNPNSQSDSENGTVSASGSGEDVSVACLDTWRAVWARRPVPDYASADVLWHSEVGRALRLPRVPSVADTIAIDDVPDPALTDAAESEVLGAETFAQRLQLCRDSGIISDFDLWLFRQIWSGHDIDDLTESPEADMRFARQPDQLATYVEELTERVLGWVQSHLDTEVGLRSHPDNEGNPNENQG